MKLLSAILCLISLGAIVGWASSQHALNKVLQQRDVEALEANEEIQALRGRIAQLKHERDEAEDRAWKSRQYEEEAWSERRERQEAERELKETQDKSRRLQDEVWSEREEREKAQKELEDAEWTLRHKRP